MLHLPCLSYNVKLDSTFRPSSPGLRQSLADVTTPQGNPGLVLSRQEDHVYVWAGAVLALGSGAGLLLLVLEFFSHPTGGGGGLLSAPPWRLVGSNGGLSAPVRNVSGCIKKNYYTGWSSRVFFAYSNTLEIDYQRTQTQTLVISLSHSDLYYQNFIILSSTAYVIVYYFTNLQYYDTNPSNVVKYRKDINGILAMPEFWHRCFIRPPWP